MKKLTLALLISLSFVACKNTETKPVEAAKPVERTYPDRVNAPEQIKKPIVLMISIDGFRYDYLDLYQPPTLLKWAKSGVRADGLISAFPTLTFPNHVTLVTGLKPGHHGIVGNKFYDEKRQQFYALGDLATVNDGTWYHGTPLWTAAEQQGMLSATCYWVGSEAKIGGVDPTYYKIFSNDTPNEQRVNWVDEWLSLPEARKPHFLGLYFSIVDTKGHKFGPKSEEVKNAVLEVDSKLAILDKYIADHNMDVQIIVVSDHGMKTIDKKADISPLFVNHKMKSTGRGPVVLLYADDKKDVDAIYKDAKNLHGPFKVYKAKDYPKRWGLDDPDRRGDVLIVGDLGVYVGYKDPATGKDYEPNNIASHGWDAKGAKELEGLFIANGSMFKAGKRIPDFENVNIYPLVTHMLGLKAEKTDGDFKVLKGILK